MIRPTFREFVSKLSQGNLIPVWTEVLADFDTPVSAFKKVETGDYAFLLESVEGGEKWGRYSFLGAEPSVIFRSKGTRVEIIEEGETRVEHGDPIDMLRELLSRYTPVHTEGLPRFHGGAVGYLGYDIVRFVEELPELCTDDLGIWDSVFMITESVLVFDNVSHKIKIISNAFVRSPEEAKDAYERAVLKVSSLVKRLRAPFDAALSLKHEARGAVNGADFTSNFEKDDFLEAVRKTKIYIRAGDII